MIEAALKEVELHIPAPTRRFELADLSQHGPWLMKRFAQKLPDIHERFVAGYLSRLVWDNEHFFRYQNHAVALFQLVHSPGIKTTKLVQERFVWVEDREDKAQLEASADFYTDVRQWAKRLDAERLICCEDTDVPKSLIEVRLGRLFDTKISHARV
jgi:hypothetical protein